MNNEWMFQIRPDTEDMYVAYHCDTPDFSRLGYAPKENVTLRFVTSYELDIREFSAERFHLMILKRCESEEPYYDDWYTGYCTFVELLTYPRDNINNGIFQNQLILRLVPVNDVNWQKEGF